MPKITLTETQKTVAGVAVRILAPVVAIAVANVIVDKILNKETPNE